MSVTICKGCNGRGYVCPRCNTGHKPGDRWGRCRSRAKQHPCEGRTVDGKHEPHFDTFAECDVCRVRKVLSEQRGERYTPNGWHHDHGKKTQLCAPCTLRFQEIQTMTMEYLMEERSQLRAGQWLGPFGESQPTLPHPPRKEPQVVVTVGGQKLGPFTSVEYSAK